MCKKEHTLTLAPVRAYVNGAAGQNPFLPQRERRIAHGLAQDAAAVADTILFHMGIEEEQQR